jgi:alpha-ketoglutarate-dependent taurine dioxygenase
VFSVTEGQLNIRYVRERLPLQGQGARDEALAEAVDALERLAESVAFSFTLEPGELLLLNNLTTLHARSSFIDAADATQRRLLLQAHIDAAGFRPQGAELAARLSKAGA